MSPERYMLFRENLDMAKACILAMQSGASLFDHDRDALAEELARLSTRVRVLADCLDRIGAQAARREQCRAEAEASVDAVIARAA